MSKKFGSFRIQKMTFPANEWIWSLWNESDSPAGVMGKKRSVETIRFTAFDEQLIAIANALLEYATAE